MDCAVVYRGRDADGNVELEIERSAPHMPVSVRLVGDGAVFALGADPSFVAAAVASKTEGLKELARAPEQQPLPNWTLALHADDVGAEIHKRSHPVAKPGQVLLRFTV